MKLRAIVVEKAIIPRLAAGTRDEAIAELLDAIVAAGAIDAGLRDEYLKAVIKREKRGSTGVGQGVAIPHVKAPGLASLAVAVGVSDPGLDFNALDRQPVHLVFLVLSPEERPEEHLDAMQVIFTTLGQPQFRRFLRQATSIADVVTLLEEADASHPVR
ncbi:MAG TPA: PTS sugar transporter subunit IIA [Phycisphaerales bacterium]|nr:PTS sugar transporter subunit IIA [Phycisphaerales bacterium]HMP38206.1 PTS sugar transporter subunit IIA [Phycisphaerales bacterium]